MIFSFDIKEVSHHLYFGMVATEKFRQKYNDNIAKLAEQEKEAKENGTSFSMPSEEELYFLHLTFVIFGGLCNHADKKSLMRPNYEFAYDLTEQVFAVTDLAKQIELAWADTEPAKELLDKLPKGNQSEVDKKKVSKAKTGTK